MRTLLAILGAAVVALPVAAEDRVSLPQNYRTTLSEYLELDRTQNHDQFIRLYANPAAARGLDDSGQLPSGAVLVGEVYSVKKDDDGNVMTSSLGRRIADQLVLIAVMEKRTGWQETSPSVIDVGDWDFGAFKPDGTNAAKELDACRACHAPLNDTDFLFSSEHLSILDPSHNEGNE
ncbi:MAG: cytochrome P460 family protein [Pseudomonadota bacterium]